MNGATFRLSEQETVLVNMAYTDDYMIDSRIDRLREVTHALFLFSSLFVFSRGTFFNGCDSIMHVCVAVLTDKSVLW